MLCSICQNAQLYYLFSPYRGREIYVCSKCTNAITYPSPKLNYLKYNFLPETDKNQVDYRRYARQIMEYISQKTKRGKLLDVGCGGGYLIEEAINSGFKAEGVDPSRQAVNFCRQKNLKVTWGFLERLKYPAGSFDIVVVSHVLEHVKNQYHFLHIIRKILKKNGFLYLSQTNYTGTIPKLYGRFWEGWMPKEHFVHFSPQGIKYLLEHANLRVLDIKILPLGYMLKWQWGNLSIVANNLYNSISFIISKFRLGFPFIGDQMYILAKKDFS